jgi:hypothetical protein
VIEGTQLSSSRVILEKDSDRKVVATSLPDDIQVVSIVT